MINVWDICNYFDLIILYYIHISNYNAIAHVCLYYCILVKIVVRDLWIWNLLKRDSCFKCLVLWEVLNFGRWGQLWRLCAPFHFHLVSSASWICCNGNFLHRTLLFWTLPLCLAHHGTVSQDNSLSSICQAFGHSDAKGADRGPHKLCQNTFKWLFKLPWRY